jgi:hypothetical protein
MVLPRQFGHGTMSVVSHAGVGTVEARYCVMLVTVLSSQLGRDTMSPASPAHDGIGEAIWSWHYRRPC